MVVAAGLIGAEPGRPPSQLSEAAVLITPSTTAPAVTATTAGRGAARGQSGPAALAGRITMIGDSVMLGAANVLQARLGDGLWLDAKQNRQFNDGVDTLRALRDSGQLGTTVVVQLGTNGTVDPGAFDDMMQMLSGARRFVIVTAKVPRSWEDQVNSTLTDGAKRYKNAVILDWHNIGGAHPEYFYDDAIHLRPEGATAYAELVATADRMTALDRLIAHDEIRMLAARYALAVDSRDLDTLVGLFVDDVQVGREAFGRWRCAPSSLDRSREIGVSILYVGTHVIDLVDDDHATGWVYCKGEIQDGERWIHQAILYRDTYERRDGHWYFVRRVHRLWYGAEVGVNPLGLAPANWPEHHDGLGTVPECWDAWRAFWSQQPQGVQEEQA